MSTLFASFEDNLLDSGLALGGLLWGAKVGEFFPLLEAALGTVCVSGWHILGP